MRCGLLGGPVAAVGVVVVVVVVSSDLGRGMEAERRGCGVLLLLTYHVLIFELDGLHVTFVLFVLW